MRELPFYVTVGSGGDKDKNKVPKQAGAWMTPIEAEYLDRSRWVGHKKTGRDEAHSSRE